MVNWNSDDCFLFLKDAFWTLGEEGVYLVCERDCVICVVYYCGLLIVIFDGEGSFKEI